MPQRSVYEWVAKSEEVSAMKKAPNAHPRADENTEHAHEIIFSNG